MSRAPCLWPFLVEAPPGKQGIWLDDMRNHGRLTGGNCEHVLKSGYEEDFRCRREDSKAGVVGVGV